jgi:hypothetical protein
VYPTAMALADVRNVLRLCENAKVKFTVVRTGSSFYFYSMKTQSRPLYCAFFAYFEATFVLSGVFTQPLLDADIWST